MNTKDPIISFILQENILDEDKLQQAVEKQQETGRNLISILKADKLVSEEHLTKIIAFTNKIEFVNLSPDMIDSVAARLVSYDTAMQHGLIPIRIDKEQLFVAMSSPLNLAIRDQIATKTGYKVVPQAATAEAVKRAIVYHFSVKNVTHQDIVSMRLQQSSKVNYKDNRKANRAADAPVSRLVDSIINSAVNARASDIHIEPQEPDVKVRYRVDGILRDALEIPASSQREIVSHIKVLADMDISERRTPQDGHINANYNGKEYDLRVSSLPAVGGEKIVMRILDKSSGTWSMDDLIQSSEDREKFRALIKNPYGMMLITGPTGSGKTTTLYSLLQDLNTPGKNIVTVEDPVEYRLNGITQVQVKPNVGLTFATGLRSILRQDPDIILVGEIRDYETAEIAVSAALTGHLVLSTMHTNDATGAMSRLINIGMPPFLVASSFLGAAAQRLVRVICPDCKTSYQASDLEIERLSEDGNRLEGLELHRGSGCRACSETGYQGRTSIYEILSTSPEIKDIVIRGGADSEIKRQGIKQGMTRLWASGVKFVLNGTTTLEELMRVVDIG